MTKLLSLFIALAIFGGFHTAALAASGTGSCPPGSSTTSCPPPTGSAAIENPFKTGDSLPALFNSIIDNVLFPIGGVLAVLAFIWVGFMFVTAQGDPNKIETARRALLYVAIGTALLLGARAISLLVTNTIDALKS
jgi:type IV secretory pathway VirB2 component (pilin)